MSPPINQPIHLSGYHHTTISLICMSTHKAMATRCLSYHQAASRQHAIRALATSPLRRLALGVLFTITTTSYQTTLYSLQEIFNKRQHTNATYRVEFLHYDTTHRYLQTKSNYINKFKLLLNRSFDLTPPIDPPIDPYTHP